MPIHKPYRLFALCLAALSAANAGAADESDTPPLSSEYAELAQKYAGVTEWQGFFDSSTAGSTSKHGSYTSQSRQIEARSHGQFTLKRSASDWGWEPKRGSFRWGGNNNEQSGEVTGVTHEQYSFRDAVADTSEEWQSELGGTVRMFAVSFDINLLEQSGKVHLGFVPESDQLKRTFTGQAVVYLSSADGQSHHATKSLNRIESGNLDMPLIRTGFATDQGNALREWAAVRSGPGVLVFTYEGADANIPDAKHRSRIMLFPVYDDLEVEVTIEGYAEWRPEGSIKNPTEPGNNLVARATLKSKTGKVKDLPEVKQFRFELLDTSREPGVAMNWPLAAKDTDYDLRLTAERGGELSNSEQKLTVSDSAEDDKGQPYAEAKVDSYDFGARATLQVICELEDGREIVGLMKDAGGEQDLVRLPKRDGPDWIAESWRRDKKVGKLAADDDDEKVESQTDNGDGYTLYEEYRGFAVAGKHLEGDPEKKDFFVLNLIGADATPGIELFEELSQLRVHAKLRRSEMSQTTRLMNGNHRDAPHRVDQHGVWVKTLTRAALGDDGAATVMMKSGVAGRPGITKGVGILARDDTKSAFNKPFNLPAQDAIFAFDRAIAHELLHSVGVEHHGTGDYEDHYFFISPRHPGNRLGGPYFASKAGGDGPVKLLTEAGHDVAAKWYENYAAQRQMVQMLFGDGILGNARKHGTTGTNNLAYLDTPEKWAEYELETYTSSTMLTNGLIGVEHGQHSGHQDCVMRYSFAKFYEKKNSADKTLYMVTPGSERIGMQICRAPLGTGINAASHQPQSRYGNAAAGDGNCFARICPNDAIPPRKVN